MLTLGMVEKKGNDFWVTTSIVLMNLKSRQALETSEGWR